MIRLTKSNVDALKPTPSRQTFLWDTEVRNLGVRVTPAGVKTFVIRYRNADGRSRRMSIGRFGVLTVDQARVQARIKLGQVASGTDPADERRNRKAAPTISEICDWYLKEAASGQLLGRRNRPIKQSTLYMDRSRIERHIKPLLGNRKVASLTSGEIAKFQADVADGKTANTRRSGRGRSSAGGSGAASRSVTMLHAILNHAKRLALIKDNPAAGVRKFAGTARKRRLSTAEIIRFGQAMRELATSGEASRGLDLVTFIALTGFRLNEAQGVRRDWLEHERGCVLLPDTKSDGQRRAIGRSAMAILKRQPQMLGSSFIFPAHSSEYHYRQGPDVIVRIIRQAQIEDVTAHTLRHTFGSVAGDLGFSELTIAAMLGHGKRGVTQGYIHIDEGLRLAIEATSKTIARLLDGVQATVAPFATLLEAYAFVEEDTKMPSVGKRRSIVTKSDGNSVSPRVPSSDQRVR